MGNDSDIETDIEILEYDMERIDRQKEEAMKKLQACINEAEKIVHKLKISLQWYEDYLVQLKQNREIIEITCHRRLINLHRRIKNIKRRYADR